MNTREIAARMRGNEQLSHTSIANLFKGQTLPRLVLVLEVVRVLGGNRDEFQDMWIAAKDAKSFGADANLGTLEPEPDDLNISEFRSLPELEAAREEIQDKIHRNRAREQEAHEEYYNKFEERAKVEVRIKDLEARLALERVDKVSLEAQIRYLEAERERLTYYIEGLEVELSRMRANLLKLTEESDHINERRVEYVYEWARTEEFKVITLERRLRGN